MARLGFGLQVHPSPYSEKKVVVAKIMEVSPHPNAERLKICQVDDGSGSLVQIVCGCPSVHVGQIVPLAQIGAVLPKAVMKVSDIRGITSNGMLCSREDLGMPYGVNGLWSLDDSYTPGAVFFAVSGYNAPVVVFEVTANRRDCLSLEGIVREWKALVHHQASHIPESAISLKYANHDLKQHPSSGVKAACWLKVSFTKAITLPHDDERMLRLLGKYSEHPALNIQRIADILFGLPLHVYGDLEGDDWSVEALTQPLSWKGLDGCHYPLMPGDHVVMHQGQVVALAGMLGGEESKYQGSLRDVWFEGVAVDPVSIHHTQKRLGLRTDASLRHGRGIVPGLVAYAMSQLCAYIEGIEGAVIEKMISISPQDEKPDAVHFDPHDINRILGFDPMDNSRLALETLGFSVKVSGQDSWSVGVPWYRDDIEGSRDLVEEIIRYVGYDSLSEASEPLDLDTLPYAYDISPMVHDILVGMGFDETIHYSFIDPVWAEHDLDKSGNIYLDNPISSEMSLMRKTLLPGLLKTAHYRQDNQRPHVALYEWGRGFIRDKEGIRETSLLGLLLAGPRYPLSPSEELRESDFYDLASDVRLLMARLQGPISLRPMDKPMAFLHPGASASLWCDDKSIGCLGMVNPRLNKGYARAYYAELYVDSLMQNTSILQFDRFSKTPVVYRDLSFWVSHDMRYAVIEAFFVALDIKELKKCRLIDIYYPQGAGLMKSISLRLSLSDGNKSLRDVDVEQIMSRIQQKLSENLSVELRKNEDTNES